MHELLIVRGIYDIVREVDQELSETAFRSRIITQNGGEGGIAKRLGEALTKCFTCASVIAQAIQIRKKGMYGRWSDDLPEETTHDVLE